MADIVCIGAHPDDVEIGMGATVASMVADGRSVTIIDLTDGEPTPFGDKETRAAEASAAAEALGARRITMDMPNRYLEDTPSSRTALAQILRDERPKTVFLPSAEDAHPDHVAAASLARAACFYSKFTKSEMSGQPHRPDTVLTFHAVHRRSAISPSFVADVSEHWQIRAVALEAYVSQFGPDTHNRDLLEILDAHGRYWGSMIGVRYGEPFSSDDMLGLPSPTVLL